MPQRTRNETVIALAAIIEEILCRDNLLGQYVLTQGATTSEPVNAIKIEYAQQSNDVNRSIVPNSGIEVTIYPEPDTVPKYLAGGNIRSHKYYMVVLDQHNPTGGLTEAIEALYTDRRLFFNPNPTVRGYQELKDGKGILPPRAILFHQQAHFKQRIGS